MLLSALLASCSEIKPKEYAAVVGHPDGTMCGWCGGWYIWTDSSTWYRAEIPEPFNKENTKVWIRFTQGEKEGEKLGRWINITSIKEQ